MNRLVPGSRCAAVWRTARAIAWILVVLVLPLACSDDDSDTCCGPESGQGRSAEYMSQAMNTVELSRFAIEATAQSWDQYGFLDRSWEFDPGARTWARVDSGYQEIFVGDGETSVVVRQESVVEFGLTLLEGGVPSQDLLSADAARMNLRVRRRIYADRPGHPLDDPYDVTARLNMEFGLLEGSADTLRAGGRVTGWSAVGLETIAYDGSVEIGFDFPGRYARCTAERMALDVRLLDVQGQELDRYAGSFSADAGQGLYTGSVESERGPWRYVVNRNRGCTTGRDLAGLPVTRP